MNISSVSSTPNPYLTHRAESSQRGQDFKALQNALKTGDLASAQTAFSAFQKDLQTASQNGGKRPPLDPNSPAGKDIQALDTALKAGDIDGAKQALATFRQDMQGAQSAGRAHHHRPDNDGDGDDGGQSSNVSQTSTTNTPSTTLSLNQLA